MSLATATLIPGLLLFVLGALLLIGGASIGAFLKALPRSTVATVIFFGGAAAWFIYEVAHMSKADLIVFSSPTPLVIGFGVLALLSFKFAPDFLAVRGLAAAVLLGAWPLLTPAYMQYDKPQRLLMVTAAFIAVGLVGRATMAAAGFPPVALRPARAPAGTRRCACRLRVAAGRRGFYLLKSFHECRHPARVARPRRPCGFGQDYAL